MTIQTSLFNITVLSTSRPVRAGGGVDVMKQQLEEAKTTLLFFNHAIRQERILTEQAQARSNAVIIIRMTLPSDPPPVSAAELHGALEELKQQIVDAEQQLEDERSVRKKVEAAMKQAQQVAVDDKSRKVAAMKEARDHAAAGRKAMKVVAHLK